MWQNKQETADLVTFTQEILNGTLHFLCSAKRKHDYINALLKIENMNNDLVNNLIQDAEVLWNSSNRNPEPGRNFIE